MISIVLVGAPKLVRAINAYRMKKPLAVAAALNRGVLRIRNDIVTSMKKTPRKVHGPSLPPPTEGLDDPGGFSTMKRRKGQKLLKKGGAKPHVNKRGGKEHIPSMPGFPPAIDSARLVNSLRLDFADAKIRPTYLVAELSTIVKYAPELEYGPRRKGRKVAARPAWRPAFNRQLPRIRSEVRAAFSGGGVF